MIIVSKFPFMQGESWQTHFISGIADPFPGDEVLTPYCQWVNAADFTIPWLNNLKLRLTVADQFIAASLPNAEVRKLLFSL